MSSLQHNDPDETIKPLTEDNDPPFSEPDAAGTDAGRRLDPTHPATDSASDVDSHEQYDAGEAAAAEAEPAAGNDSGVAGYDPDRDERNVNP